MISLVGTSVQISAHAAYLTLPTLRRYTSWLSTSSGIGI